MGSSSLQFKFPARANFRSGKIITLSLFLNLRLYFHRGNQVSLERNIVTSEWYLFVNLGHFPWNRKWTAAIDRRWKLTDFKAVVCENLSQTSPTFLRLENDETTPAPFGAARVSGSSIFVRNWGEFFAFWEKLLGVELPQLSAKVGQEERQIGKLWGLLKHVTIF